MTDRTPHTLAGRGLDLARFGLAAGIAAAPVFIVTDLLDAGLRPGYSPLRHWVSHLALGQYGWIGTSTLVASALLLCANAAALLLLRRREHIRSLQPVFAAVSAAGLLAAAAFPMSPSLGFPPNAVPPGTPTISGVVHDVAGPVFILGLGIAAMLSERLLRQLRLAGGWTRYGWLVGVAVVLAMVTTSALVTLDYAGLVPGAWSGLFERVAIYLGLIWTSAVSARLLGSTRIQPTKPPGGRDNATVIRIP